MALYQVPWISGSVGGVRNLWAPDGDTAAATVEANPSSFGIPHQSVVVGIARLVLEDPWSYRRAV